MSVPRGYYSVKGLCPDGRGTCEFCVSINYVEHLQRIGPTWRFWNLHIIPEILGNPVAIFKGLQRDDFEDGFCYSGKPSKRMLDSRVEAPLKPDTVAVVFVHQESRGTIVLDWEWRVQDLDQPGWPDQWREDFQEVSWRKT
jgi:hypothetical protein